MSNSNRFVANWADQQREWLRDSRGSLRKIYRCELCNVDCQGYKGLEAHKKGKKCKKRHRIKQRELEEQQPQDSLTSSTLSTSSAVSST